MRVYRDLNQLPEFTHSVITIGTFDGVHLGHQKLIQRIQSLSKQIKGESILITFYPHPRLVINPEDTTLQLLNTLEEKIELLAASGVDNLVVVPFSRDFSEQDAAFYVKDFLVKNFHPKYIVIGYDHKFGRNRTGDFALLKSGEKQYGYEVQEITKETLDDIDISSTKIRKALGERDVKLAAELLGHPYSLSGTVVKGLQNGRKLGYPTANIQINDKHKLIPASGIYAVTVKIGENTQRFNGMMSIGYNPTFEAKVQTLEVNILDFERDIYGENITVYFDTFIRLEKKFNSLDDLIAAIQQDEKTTRQLIALKA